MFVQEWGASRVPHVESMSAVLDRGGGLTGNGIVEVPVSDR